MKFVCIIGFLALLISCGDTDKIVIAYQDRIGDAPFILMAEQDRNENSPYHWMRFSSGPESAEALITGSARMASMGDTAALQVLSRYPGKFVLIGSHASGKNRHRIVVSSEDDSLHGLSDLEGKIVALKKGTSTHGGYILMSRREGLGDNVEILDLKPSLQLNALSSGEVDAIIASEPTPSIAVQKGYGRVLAPVDLQGLTFPITLLAEKAWALEHKREIKDFLIKLEEIYRHLDENGNLKKLLDVTGLDPVTLKESMQMHSYEFIPGKALQEELSCLFAVLSETGYYRNPPDWDSSFLP